MLKRQTKLILWDEAPMTNKLAFEVVDQTLHDFIDRDKPFGDIVFVMSRDFRQVLPIIPRGSHADIVSASIENSYLWESVEVFCLSENMWVERPNLSSKNCLLCAHSLLLARSCSMVVCSKQQRQRNSKRFLLFVSHFFSTIFSF
jgi:hypothetical protein